jgi:hypothetical protein
VVSSQRHRVIASSKRAHCSTQLLHRSPDVQRFVDYGIPHTSLDRRSMPPVTALKRRVRTDVEVSGQQPGMRAKYRKARPSLVFER